MDFQPNTENNIDETKGLLSLKIGKPITFSSNW